MNRRRLDDNAPYQLSRSSLRERYGSRAINAADPNLEQKNTNSATAVGSDASRSAATGLTDRGTWDSFFNRSITPKFTAEPRGNPMQAGGNLAGMMPAQPPPDPLFGASAIQSKYGTASVRFVNPQQQVAQADPFEADAVLNSAIANSTASLRKMGIRNNNPLASVSTWDEPIY